MSENTSSQQARTVTSPDRGKLDVRALVLLAVDGSAVTVHKIPAPTAGLGISARTNAPRHFSTSSPISKRSSSSNLLRFASSSSNL